MQAEFFANEDELASYDLLKKAIVENDHVDSIYAFCIIRLFSPVESIRLKGASDLVNYMVRGLFSGFKTRINRVTIKSERIQYDPFIIDRYENGLMRFSPFDPIMRTHPHLVQADMVVQELFGDNINWISGV